MYIILVYEAYTNFRKTGHNCHPNTNTKQSCLTLLGGVCYNENKSQIISADISLI